MKTIYQGKTKTNKEIIVRYPEIGDLEKLLDFINTISDEKTFISYQGEHETLESERKYIKGRLKAIKNKKVTHLLAFYNDELVGSSDIQMGEKTEKHIGVFGLIISKNFRGEGIGKTLMHLVEEEAKRNLPNLKTITLEVYSSNNVARGLYKKMSFTEYGMLPKGIIRGEKFEDTILMYKNL